VKLFFSLPLVFWLFLSGTVLSDARRPQLIIWNIGQGQWVTLSTLKTCAHYDIGGEFVKWPAIENECRSKLNLAHFSHWDQDHIGLATQAAHHLARFCVVAPPQGPGNERKRELFRKFDSCPDADPSWSQQIYDGMRPMQTAAKRDSNDYSRVYELKHLAIVQGDSPQKEEKYWSERILSANEIHYLILGHHGSRTSTSKKLLQHLANLKMAIASARKSRYGHPHKETLDRLREFHVPVLKTEDWGTVRIELGDFF
jgi:competence protein ComEC